MTGEELKQRNIAAMGEEAGTQYSLLNNEVAFLHLYWKEYVELFSTNQKRIDRLEAVKFRSSRFGAIGRSWRLSVVRARRGRAMMALMP